MDGIFDGWHIHINFCITKVSSSLRAPSPSMDDVATVMNIHKVTMKLKDDGQEVCTPKLASAVLYGDWRHALNW
jgi:hypothetical protein